MVYPEHKFTFPKEPSKNPYWDKYFERAYRPNNLWRQFGAREPICDFDEFEEFKHWLIESEFATMDSEKVRRFVNSVANLQEVAEILYLQCSFETDTRGGTYFPEDYLDRD